MTGTATQIFTQTDLADWLACSREAGRRVWFTSGLYTHMQYFATKRALERFSFDKLVNHLSLPEQSGLPEALNEMAADVILDYHAWIKENKKPEDFATLGIGGFLNYTKSTLEHRFFDRLVREMQLKPRRDLTEGDRSQDSDENDEYKESPLTDKCHTMVCPSASQSPSRQRQIYADTRPDPELMVIAEDYQERCRKLLQKFWDEFHQSPELAKNPALAERLLLLSRLPESEPWEVMGFLTNNHRHLEYKEFAQKQLAAKFNQNSWNSYNRRLKLKWAEFLSGHPHQGEVAELQECLQCLREAQRLS